MSNIHLFENKALTDAAIFASHLCQITIFNSSFVSNIGSSIAIVDYVFLQINECQFINNSAYFEGGAIRGTSHCVVNVTNTIYSHNKAVTSGGALYVESTTDAHLQNCLFTYNSAYKGGSLSVVNSNIRIITSNFTKNIANNGGVFVIKGNMIAVHCIMNNNTVTADGGVGYFEENSQSNIRFSILRGNKAHGSGGVFGSEKALLHSSIYPLYEIGLE